MKENVHWYNIIGNRNHQRFPQDFMFQLTIAEKDEVVAICDHLKTLKYSPNLPCVFTEHGAVMLASVLNSKRAHKDILLKMEQLEKQVINHDERIVLIFEYLNQLLSAEQEPRVRIGFRRYST